jgi:hypothetical protein
MNKRHTLMLAVAAAAVPLLLPGCGPSSASVSGEVTYEDQSVGDGYITFTPADGKGQDAGGPITGGHYQVAGLPPGPKLVKIVAVKKVNFASTSEEMMKRAAEARKRGDHDGLVDPADVIPENAQGNNTAVELKPGSQEQHFHLKKPGRATGN